MLTTKIHFIQISLVLPNIFLFVGSHPGYRITFSYHAALSFSQLWQILLTFDDLDSFEEHWSYILQNWYSDILMIRLW